MSIRARVAAAAVSASVIALGWQIGTANGTAAGNLQDNTTNSNNPGANTATTSGNASANAGAARTAGSAGSIATQSASTGSYKNGTYQGTTVTHRFGSVAVSVTITGGKITAVNATVRSDGDRKSDMINNQAIPLMKQQVLAANSAQVSTIGGATYTTAAYLSSLQSALDKAK